MKANGVLKVNYLPTKSIKKVADEFRARFSEPGQIPLDIEKIIEFKLGIKIIPVPNLRSLCDIDAFISSDMKHIFVDQDTYDDDRRQNRIRMSLAHEVAHYVLHKGIYEDLEINGIEDYYAFNQAKNEGTCKFHEYAESQARIFANMLLIPREELSERKISLMKQYQEYNLEEITDTEALNDFLAIPLSKEFSVSESAMNIALSNLVSDLSK